jgi:hypothetical protein
MQIPTYILISYGTDADNQRAVHALTQVVYRVINQNLLALGSVQRFEVQRLP